jgi:methionyl-tRNA formyltransferase
LEAILAGVAAELLTETLGPWLAGEIAAVQQGDEGATLTRPLRRDDGRLDPTRGIDFLDRQIRAFQPWPGTFVETQLGRVKILDARPLDAGSSRTPGQLIRLPANRLALAARDGLLELVDVQPAGGRRMSGAELLRGRPTLAGSMVLESSPEEGGTSA